MKNPDSLLSVSNQGELATLRSIAAARLAEAGVPSPEADAEILLAHVLGLTRSELSTQYVLGQSVSDLQRSRLAELVSRRVTREPLQHITGIASFRYLELAVGPGVFVPRPETEIVAQVGIDFLRSCPGETIAVDLCSGSGAIALALATEVSTTRVWAVERSSEAFRWLVKNIAASDSEVAAVHADLSGESLDMIRLQQDSPAMLRGNVDLVISNPPYVPDDAIPRDLEVRLHDPVAALYSGSDGLDLIRIIAVRALQLCRPGGALVLEHGEHQASSVAEILRLQGWEDITTHVDLTGRDRATLARAPESGASISLTGRITPS